MPSLAGEVLGPNSWSSHRRVQGKQLVSLGLCGTSKPEQIIMTGVVAQNWGVSLPMHDGGLGPVSALP